MSITGYSQILGAAYDLSTRGSGPDCDCGGKDQELLHFTIPKNELKSHVFPFKLQYKNNSNSFV